jgi:hypothetical protein
MNLQPISVMALAAISMVNAIAYAATANTMQFPAGFIGKWREVPAQCSDMTETGVDVGANTINFYYRAKLQTLVVVGKTEVKGTAAITGEGQTRTKPFHFRLSPEGNQMLEIDTDGSWLTLRRRCRR